MPRKAFFCYERGTRGWHPVIYYDQLPQSSQGKELTPDRQIVTDVSQHVVDDEVDLSFDTLQKMYPHPENPLKKGQMQPTIDIRKEKMMPRPVKGFLTANGKYFETEQEATLYEESMNIHELATEAVENLLKDIENETISITKDTLVDYIKSFLNSHESAILDYINARREVSTGQQNTNGMARQAAGNNSTNDPRVRDSSNREVDNVAETETTVEDSRAFLEQPPEREDNNTSMG